MTFVVTTVLTLINAHLHSEFSIFHTKGAPKGRRHPSCAGPAPRTLTCQGRPGGRVGESKSPPPREGRSPEEPAPLPTALAAPLPHTPPAPAPRPPPPPPRPPSPTLPLPRCPAAPPRSPPPVSPPLRRAPGNAPARGLTALRNPHHEVRTRERTRALQGGAAARGRREVTHGHVTRCPRDCRLPGGASTLRQSGVPRVVLAVSAVLSARRRGP